MSRGCVGHGRDEADGKENAGCSAWSVHNPLDLWAATDGADVIFFALIDGAAKVVFRGGETGTTGRLVSEAIGAVGGCQGGVLAAEAAARLGRGPDGTVGGCLLGVAAVQAGGAARCCQVVLLPLAVVLRHGDMHWTATLCC
ncbi:MAG: hypothetical protein ACPLPR_01310 [Bacillota bacterium]